VSGTLVVIIRSLSEGIHLVKCSASLDHFSAHDEESGLGLLSELHVVHPVFMGLV
jgi:hypothetical protein